jgi:hypothetical protein
MVSAYGTQIAYVSALYLRRPKWNHDNIRMEVRR